jgi:hypothetical protein
MDEDAVPSGDAPSELSTPVRRVRRRTALLLLGGIMLTFVSWTGLLFLVFDHSILTDTPNRRGLTPLLPFLAIYFSLALAGAASQQFSVPKSWLERGFYVAALLLFEVFGVAIAINIMDSQLPSDYKNALGGVAFCCGSLSLSALVWWLELSPSNPFLPRDGFQIITALRETPPSRHLWEMPGRGIPLIFATALLVIPPLTALTLIALDWQDESKVVFSYPAGVLTLFGAFILLCVVGVRAWQRGRRHDAASRDIPAGTN